MGFEYDPTAEDIKVFLDEADEFLQLMEAEILKLESDVENPEHLQEIFRAAHTLKGSSATLGHQKMAEVTHAMENVLDKLRKGKLVLTTRVVDTLFSCLDVLKSFKQEIATGEESTVDSQEILDRLSEVNEGDSRVSTARGASSSASVQSPGPSAMPPLTEAEQAAIQAGATRGLHPVWSLINLDKTAPMPAVRAFQALLAAGDMGEVVRSWPTQDEVEEDRVGDDLKMVFLTNWETEKVRAVLSAIPEISVVQLMVLPGSGREQVAAPAPLPAPAADVAVPVQAAAASLVMDAPSSAASMERSAPSTSKSTTRSSSRTVRVDVDVLDNLMNLVGELVIDRTRLTQVLTQLETEREGDEMIQQMSSALAHIGRMTSDLQEEIQRARMLPVDNLFKKFPRMVRDTAQKALKEIEFVMRGEETELDRSVIEEIGDPLMHLIRNAADHGIEPPMERIRVGKPSKGTLILEAFHEENHIIISVRDDGRGMDPNKIRNAAVRKGLISEEVARRMSDSDAINLIWLPGFSTAEKVSDLSGRGVGLDVVQKNIEKLNGSVEIKSEIGKGTEFRVKLPLTLAIIRALQVRVLDTIYCMPLSSVMETDRIPVSEIQTVRQREVIVKRGEVIPLVRLDEAFQLERPADYTPPDDFFVVIVAVFSKQIGIVVDSLIGEGDVVIKPLGKFIGDVPGISGATIMGDGDVAIILDISSMITTVQADINRREVVGVRRGD